MPTFSLAQESLVDGRIRLARLLALAGLATTNADGRRKIAQGGVKIAGERVEDPDIELEPAALDGRVVQVGRRSWARVEVEKGSGMGPV